MLKIKMFFGALLLCLCSFHSLSADDKKNELRLSVGMPIYFDYDYNYSNFWGGGSYDGYGYYNDTFRGNRYGLPSVNVSYAKLVKPRLAIGVTASYYGSYQNSYYYKTFEKSSRLFQTNVCITPFVRYDWKLLRGKYFGLYSQAGIGIGLDCQVRKNKDDGSKDYYITAKGSFDFVFWGFTIGKDIFFFSEFGVSNIGVIKAGVGYKF